MTMKRLLRREMREEVRRSKAQGRGLLDWTDFLPMLLPVVAVWLMVLVQLADRT
jgi:hypothetical protein